MSITRYIAQKGDRWDIVAFKAYGDATKYQDIIKANPTVPIRPYIQAGTIINVPVIEGSETPLQSDLPPWKR